MIFFGETEFASLFLCTVNENNNIHFLKKTHRFVATKLDEFVNFCSSFQFRIFPNFFTNFGLARKTFNSLQKYYVKVKIQQSNFDILANNQMRYLGH